MSEEIYPMNLDIIDDCIPEFYQDYFEALCLGKTKGCEIENGLAWTPKYESTACRNGISPLSFKHILKSDAELSSHFVNFSTIPVNVVNRLRYVLNQIIYARLFLTTPYDTDLQNHDPHVDLNFPHTSLIYYVNDADGDTVFYDNDYKNIINSVTPKKGRCVIFDGLIPHGAGIPKLGPRCIVNFNLILGDNN